MKNQFKTTLLIGLSFFLLNASASTKKNPKEETKVIEKKFTVNNKATLEVVNKYGDINITTWDKNEIEIKVIITAKSKLNDTEKLKERLNEISIDFSESSNKVSARTLFSSTKWHKKMKRLVSIRVHYTIKMPVTNAAEISNKYGSISLDTLEGSATINCDYGSIEIENLKNSENHINLDYSNKSSIKNINSGVINTDYSSLRIDTSNKLEINSDYSHIKLGEVKKVGVVGDYGSFKLEKVESFKGRFDYIKVNLGLVQETCIVNNDYGKIVIDKLGSKIKEVDIQSSYSGVSIGVDENAKFNFQINTSYTSFENSLGEAFKIIKSQSEKSRSKFYSGYLNTKDTGNKMNINCDYGKLKIEKHF